MKPFIDETRLERVNTDLSRALADGDPDVLAGRFALSRPKPKATEAKGELATVAAGRVPNASA